MVRIWETENREAMQGVPDRTFLEGASCVCSIVPRDWRGIQYVHSLHMTLRQKVRGRCYAEAISPIGTVACCTWCLLCDSVERIDSTKITTWKMLCLYIVCPSLKCARDIDYVNVIHQRWANALIFTNTTIVSEWWRRWSIYLYTWDRRASLLAHGYCFETCFTTHETLWKAKDQ